MTIIAGDIVQIVDCENEYFIGKIGIVDTVSIDTCALNVINCGQLEIKKKNVKKLEVESIVWKDLYNNYQIHILAIAKNNIMHIFDIQNIISLASSKKRKFDKKINIIKRLVEDIAKEVKGDYQEIFFYDRYNVHSIWDGGKGYKTLGADRINKDCYQPFFQEMKKQALEELE